MEQPRKAGLPAPTSREYACAMPFSSDLLRCIWNRLRREHDQGLTGELEVSCQGSGSNGTAGSSSSWRTKCPLLTTPTRAEERRDAGLQTSRSRRQSARKMSRKPSLGLPHQQRVSNVQKALDATMKKPCVGLAGLLGTSLARSGLQVAFLGVKWLYSHGLGLRSSELGGW